MLTQMELEREIQRNSLHCFEARTGIEMEDEAIELLSLDDLFSFAKSNNLSIFYFYAYTSAENLIIDDDVLKEVKIDDEAKEVVGGKIEEYNKVVQNLEFERPIGLRVFCLWQGFIVYYEERDYWFEEKGVGKPEEKALEMANAAIDMIVAIKRKRQEERSQKRDHLKIQILNDENFHECKNQALRKKYLDQLIERDTQLRPLFYDDENHTYFCNPYVYIDEIWKEYRKIQAADR